MFSIDPELVRIKSVVDNHVTVFEAWEKTRDKMATDPCYTMLRTDKYKLLSGVKVNPELKERIAPIYHKYLLLAEIEICAYLRKEQELLNNQVVKAIEGCLPDEAEQPVA